MAVFYSPVICQVIGHSHLLTDSMKCSRCGEETNYAYKTTRVLHASGHWCSECEKVKLTFWDRLMLPESIITHLEMMKPSEPRPSSPGGLY